MHSNSIWDYFKFNQKKDKLIVKKILISTGGSGGHVIPAITLFEHYNESFETYLVSDKRGAKYINNNKYPFEIIDTPKISKNIIKIPFILIFFLISILRSYFFLRKKNIQYLISTGGYMSFPFCISAKLLNIKIFLFEPNMVIGKSNKFFLNFSKKIICYSDQIKNFPDNHKNKKLLINPLLRKEIYNLQTNIERDINLPFKLLIIGGSQGAKFFDEKVVELVKNLSKENEIYVTQQISDQNKKIEIIKKYDEINLKYELFSFNNDLYKKFNNIDFAITRAGSSTISELAFYNIPFLAVPFPFAKDNHQFYNAKYYSDQNLCWLVKQEDFDLDKISNLLTNLIRDNKEHLIKKQNMAKFSYQNTWNNINQKLTGLINEN